jgi:NADH:ubiquinone oxidoreductase subunit 3 (subunit A)
MMMWFLLIIVAIVALIALAAVVVLALLLAPDDNEAAEAARIEAEVRLAERRLHDISRQTFQAMLEEARAHDHTRVS